MKFVKQSILNGIGILTLDNDTKSNSLNLQMLDGIVEVMSDFKRKDIPVVIYRKKSGLQ
jgi:enoyl-CoA hydratase/carnithine racemase